MTEQIGDEGYIPTYFGQKNWLIKENANQNKSYSQMKGFIAGEEIKKYTLNKYPKEIKRLHNEGYFHLHDLSNGIIPYCCGIDFLELLDKGLITDRIISKPAKHLDTALNQLVNRLCTQQQEWAGAQAAGDFNTLLAPFIAKDGLSYDDVKQSIQRFVFDMNYPSRSGYETPFSNIMLNTKCPENLKEFSPWFDTNNTYEDFEDESLMILRAFNEILLEGDGKQNPFAFPIPTINIIKSTKFDTDLWYEIGKTMEKYGSYYFMNFDGSGISANSTRAMCCRLRLDLTELPPAGGRWAFQGSTGSIGVVSLNMAKLGYLSKNEADFFERLNYLLEKAKESLLLKNVWCQEMLDEGYMPVTKNYNIDFNRYFRTIGVIGLHEMVLNFMGYPIWEEEGKLFVKKVLMYIRNWSKRAQMETGKLWNVEMTPGEGSATRLAFVDRSMYKDIITQGDNDGPYYTTMLTPSNRFIDLFERINIEEDLLPLFTGGTAFRVYLGERHPSPEGLIKLTERIAKYTKIPYYDFATSFSICKKCGQYERGEISKCSKCGGETSIFARIVGYYRDISRANVGKYKEIKERKYYNF